MHSITLVLSKFKHWNITQICIKNNRDHSEAHQPHNHNTHLQYQYIFFSVANCPKEKKVEAYFISYDEDSTPLNAREIWKLDIKETIICYTDICHNDI